MKISYNLIGTRHYLLAKLTPFSNAQFEFLRTKQAETSKHLKGQLDPPVRNVTFLHKGGQLDPPHHDITFLHQGFQLDPPVRNVMFLHQGGQLDPPVRDVTFLQLDPPIGHVTVSD